MRQDTWIAYVQRSSELLKLANDHNLSLETAGELDAIKRGHSAWQKYLYRHNRRRYDKVVNLK